jgi:hypothetical protein
VAPIDDFLDRMGTLLTPIRETGDEVRLLVAGA